MPVTCTLCSKEFANSKSLSTHKYTYHRDQAKMGHQKEDDAAVKPYGENKEIHDASGGDNTSDGSSDEEDGPIAVPPEEDTSDEEGFPLEVVPPEEDTSDEEEEEVYDGTLDKRRLKDVFDVENHRPLSRAYTYKQMIDKITSEDIQNEGSIFTEREWKLIDAISSVSSLTDIAGLLEENKAKADNIWTKY